MGKVYLIYPLWKKILNKIFPQQGDNQFSQFILRKESLFEVDAFFTLGLSSWHSMFFISNFVCANLSKKWT